MTRMNRKWLLARRPTGLVSREDFEWREETVPSIGDGQFLVHNQWLSCDPAQRTYMDTDTYIPKVGIGEVMVSVSAAEVVESNNPDFAVGDVLAAAYGWQEYAVSDGAPFAGLVPPLKIPPGVDPPTALSLLGVTGLTAYFGLVDVGQPNPGDTVVVSGAAGAVGSLVCQIAKIKGCRVVGIAGGQHKCDVLRDEFGADDAIDYKSESVYKRLGETCPDGIDVYFDNVGGAILDAALARLASGGRIVLCGSVSGYSNADDRAGIRNLANLTLQRGTMRGFLVFDYLGRAQEAIGDMAGWAGEGRIKNRIDVVEGLENAPDALRRLFTGENLGKQLVKI